MARKLTILYGSQTGYAQDLAEYIWRESKRYYFKGTVMSLDKYDIQQLIYEKFVVFVCSTTGQGEEPDNMKTFWRFLLRKSLPPDSLCSLNCAVLGMGDSSYEKFNFAAKRLNKRLQQLGANLLIPIGLCDDQHDLGPSAVYVNWLNDLWNELLIRAPLPDGLKPLTETPRQFRWNVEIVKTHKITESIENVYENYRDAVFDKTTFKTTVIENRRTTAEEHFQDVRLISFKSDLLNWQPGDVLVVRPNNSDEQVDELFDIFNEHNFEFGADTIVQLHEIDAEMPVPDFLKAVLPLKTIAKQLWDLNAVPRQHVFKVLSLNCEDELEKEKLLEFTTAEGQEELFTYANRPRRTILEVLRDFHKSTSKLNLELLFEIFQFIKTRSFSIASCVEHGKLEVLVAVVQYKTILSTPRKGLCSNWLKQLKCGDEIQAVIKRGTFKIPSEENSTTPIIMVGPGTGLAPFRAFLLQQFYRLKNKANAQHFPFTLFFGCRGEKLDFHCKDDLLELQEQKLLKLFTAFSRDQDHKIYVQHRITEQCGWLREQIIDKSGVFLVAGNSKNMPTAVKEALSEALNNSDYVQTMIDTGRYQEETWA
ncbi:NADPH-dependent diflavin oxidoreductase 1 [Contarinia nasturtii]|uniref:NADPH-dependent diflavin oxidoreductase 1 n=1 Tax=Contarinia nasturtii TaxID=265458 RepID=UPI0012D40287|nr:NADPH-dependent diflavin oxidoreductase 1 [Contarinia nasturtii]